MSKSTSGIWSILTYDTVRVVRVYNPCLALLKYTLLFVIGTYVFFWQILAQRQYQAFDQAVGAVTIKMKGSAIDAAGKVWDAPRVRVPGIYCHSSISSFMQYLVH